MSNSRNKRNPIRQLFQLNAVAPASVIHCPATSSMTMCPGSFRPLTALQWSPQRCRRCRTSTPAIPIRYAIPTEQIGNHDRRCRSDGPWSDGRVAASEPCGQHTREAILHRCRSRGGDLGSSSGLIGVEITYFSVAHAPRSINGIAPNRTGSRACPVQRAFCRSGTSYVREDAKGIGLRDGLKGASSIILRQGHNRGLP